MSNGNKQNVRRKKYFLGNPFISSKDTFLKKDRCFLCGSKLTKRNSTQEHVFPKWLLRKYGLGSAGLTLSNGVTLLYHKIKVPCCSDCNNVYLSQLERKIMLAADAGHKEFAKLGEETVFLWVLKIFYEILFLETTLSTSPRYPQKGSIFEAQQLERISHLHIILQAVRGKTDFSTEKPWSVFVFKINPDPGYAGNFDFKDNVSAFTFSIRMGDIGVIACLQDNGAHKYHSGEYAVLKKKALHPIQFDEMFARVTYKELTRDRVPKYLFIGDANKCHAVVMPMFGMSQKPIYGEWDSSVYAKYLAFYLNFPYEHVFTPPNQFMSWVYDDKGRFKNLKKELKGRASKPINHAGA